jgi:hypothetical protein
MKLIIAGCVRNIEKQWSKSSSHLQTIFDSVDDYLCVIVESNSTDNSLKLLEEWACLDSRRRIIAAGTLAEQSRTKRIALCRNMYMDYLKPYFPEFTHTLIVDLDTSLEIDSSFRTQLQTCFKNSEWDAIASNRRGRYYDIWALRSEKLGITFDCWDQISKFRHVTVNTPQGQRTIPSVHYFVYQYQQAIPESSEWIPVESAFGCMVLYKSESIRDRRYNGDTTCEHVSFNSGLKMFINPALISGGEALEHLG